MIILLLILFIGIDILLVWINIHLFYENLKLKRELKSKEVDSYILMSHYD